MLLQVVLAASLALQVLAGTSVHNSQRWRGSWAFHAGRVVLEHQHESHLKPSTPLTPEQLARQQQISAYGGAVDLSRYTNLSLRERAKRYHSKYHEPVRMENPTPPTDEPLEQDTTPADPETTPADPEESQTSQETPTDTENETVPVEDVTGAPSDTTAVPTDQPAEQALQGAGDPLDAANALTAAESQSSDGLKSATPVDTDGSVQTLRDDTTPDLAALDRAEGAALADEQSKPLEDAQAGLSEGGTQGEAAPIASGGDPDATASPTQEETPVASGTTEQSTEAVPATGAFDNALQRTSVTFAQPDTAFEAREKQQEQQQLGVDTAAVESTGTDASTGAASLPAVTVQPLATSNPEAGSDPALSDPSITDPLATPVNTDESGQQEQQPEAQLLQQDPESSRTAMGTNSYALPREDAYATEQSGEGGHEEPNWESTRVVNKGDNNRENIQFTDGTGFDAARTTSSGEPSFADDAVDRAIDARDEQS